MANRRNKGGKDRRGRTRLKFATDGDAPRARPSRAAMSADQVVQMQFASQRLGFRPAPGTRVLWTDDDDPHDDDQD